MVRKDPLIPVTTKQHGPKTEEPTSSHFSKLSRDEEGNSVTLPFFIDSVGELSKSLSLDQTLKNDIARVAETYPFRISGHYLSLIDKESPLSCPVGRQAVPSAAELDGSGEIDPLNEGGSLITPTFLKRYPGRGVFLVSAECAMYCRFCNRRRLVGKGWNPALFVEETLRYLEEDKDIGEVILSGGDPFMLPPEELGYILARLKGMKKRIIRISTRMPVVSPERLVDAYFEILEEYEPLWIVIHINHFKEITPGFVDAVKRLRRSGAALVSQTVLLRGVNDCSYVLGKLFEDLVSQGVKPYYLFQLDEVQGASHFKVKLEKGIEIMKDLRRSISGLAIPHYALDISGGLGKVPVDHQYLGERTGDRLVVESPLGGVGGYEDNGMESCCTQCGVCRSTGRYA
jgi:lysine 2,3-aminomutase